MPRPARSRSGEPGLQLGLGEDGGHAGVAVGEAQRHGGASRAAVDADGAEGGLHAGQHTRLEKGFHEDLGEVLQLLGASQVARADGAVECCVEPAEEVVGGADAAIGALPALPRAVLEIAPYYLSISPLDVDFIEVVFGFDLEAQTNRDQVVFEALLADSALGAVMGGGAVLSASPVLASK